MEIKLVLILPILYLHILRSISAKDLPGPLKQTWGYIQVRPNAKIFYWLQCAGDPTNYTNYPLVIWLQGGPGCSSTGVGNFEEIGPSTVDLTSRNYTLLRKANLLFIDSPVGAGFSYVNASIGKSSNVSFFASNMSQVVDDLMSFMKQFLQKLPEFQKVPIHIFGESYGGKVAANFALTLNKACLGKKIGCILNSVTLGDPWISPLDNIKSWGHLLYEMSLVDSRGKAALKLQATKIETLILTNQYKRAMDQYFKTLHLINNLTSGVDVFNILNTDTKMNFSNIPKENEYYSHFYQSYALHNFSSPKLYRLMNGKIKEQLGTIPQNVTWGGQANQAFDALKSDHLKSAIESVDNLLNSTSLKITLYTSQLDLLVDTSGTLSWLNRLTWPGLTKLRTIQRVPFYLIDHPKRTAGFTIKYKNFALFWILRAGHMVPKDNPEAAFTLSSKILDSSY